MESLVYNTDLKYVNEIVDEILEIDNTDLNDVKNLGLKEKLEMIKTFLIRVVVYSLRSFFRIVSDKRIILFVEK